MSRFDDYCEECGRSASSCDCYCEECGYSYENCYCIEAEETSLETLARWQSEELRSMYPNKTTEVA